MLKPLDVTVTFKVTLWPLVSLMVAMHVPAETPVTTKFQVGPAALVAENVATAVPVLQLFVWLSVPL